MKKLLLIAAVVLMASCGKSGKDKTAKKWSDEDRKAFTENCVSSAAMNMDSSVAKSYCDCMLNKMMDKYPVADSAMNITMDQMMTMAQDCMK